MIYINAINTTRKKIINDTPMYVCILPVCSLRTTEPRPMVEVAEPSTIPSITF